MRRALWVALVVNLVMFLTEVGASWASGSVSLLADAVGFFGDAANYGLSLAVLSMALHVRSSAAIVKAACMAAFGIFVLAPARRRPGRPARRPSRSPWVSVYGTATAWPDLLVAALMAMLAVTGAVSVSRHARMEPRGSLAR